MAVLDAVGTLTEDVDPATLSARTDAAVRQVVATDVLSFEAFGNDRDYRGPLWYSPSGSVPAERLQIMAEMVFDHVLVDDVLNRRVNQAVTVSDYLTLQQFRTTPIYNEFFRYLKTDRQLTVGLYIKPDLVITASLCRLRSDFSKEERYAMELLTPHLVSAFRNAKFVSRLKGDPVFPSNIGNAVRFGSINVDEHCIQLIEIPPATDLIRRYFGGAGSAIRPTGQVCQIPPV